MIETLECEGSELYELGKQLVDAGVSFRFEARGWSMYPLIRDQDVLEVAPVVFGELGAGDVVFFRSGSRLLAHRVVGTVATAHETLVRVRGDALVREDPPVGEGDLVGRVTLVHRPYRQGHRVIRLDRGVVHWLGVLVARSRIAHRSGRWTAWAMHRWETLLKGDVRSRSDDRAQGRGL